MRFILCLLLFALIHSVSYSNDAIYVDNYSKAIALSKDINHKVLLIFDADWCVNCVVLKKDLAENIPLKDMIVCILDIDNHKDLAKNFHVKKIPVSILIENNMIMSKYIGYDNVNKYSDWLKSKGAL